jgi:multiple sugar transport system permease protein
MNIIDTPLVSLIPALCGQGIKSSIFVLVFYQFYSSYPKAFDEAASIDGAGPFKTWIKIAVPMVGPAILVTFLFTFIWSWNETFSSSLYFGSTFSTLPMKLESFVDAYSRLYSTNDYSTANKLNEAIRMAGTLLTIAPLIVVYVFLQRFFIEGIESTGITGE